MEKFKQGDIVYSKSMLKLMVDGYSESSDTYLVLLMDDNIIVYDEKYLAKDSDIISEREYLSINRKSKINNFLD